MALDTMRSSSPPDSRFFFVALDSTRCIISLKEERLRRQHESIQGKSIRGSALNSMYPIDEYFQRSRALNASIKYPACLKNKIKFHRCFQPKTPLMKNNLREHELSMPHMNAQVMKTNLNAQRLACGVVYVQCSGRGKLPLAFDRAFCRPLGRLRWSLVGARARLLGAHNVVRLVAHPSSPFDFILDLLLDFLADLFKILGLCVDSWLK